MLARANCLKGSSVFKNVEANGTLYQSANFGVSILNRRDAHPIRFGFVISTKVSKLAVQRNRIKRAMSESARHNLKSLKNGYDVVFLAKTTVEKKTTQQIMDEVKIFLTNSVLKK